MNLIAIGINYKTAPVALREQLAITDADLPTALQSLTDTYATEAIIVSTCNRIEIYAMGTTPEAVQAWLTQYQKLDPELLEAHWYSYSDADAVAHAMKVAAGLDSMVLGEPQILGQFKHAVQVATDIGCLHNGLKNICHKIFEAAKAVRHQTAIGHCPVSVAFSAVKLAQQTLADLTQHKALVIGSGQTARLLAQHLQSSGIAHITIANRTLENAQLLAEQVDGAAMTLTELPTALIDADIVISATDSDSIIITQQMLASIKRQAPLLIIDIAVPRDIDPSVADLPNVILHCIDDIQQTIHQNTLQRSQAAMQAHDIIEAHLQAFLIERKARQATASLCTFRQHIETISQELLDKSLKQLHSGQDPEEVLKQFSHKLTQRLMHQPSLNIHRASSEGHSELMQLAHKLFDIPEH